MILYCNDDDYPDDNEDDDSSSLPSEEGSGPDDEDLSYLFTDVMESDVSFRCYRCTGITEQSGCNLTSLRENPADYVTDCDGHCLNISTADSTVFDCTANVPLRSAKCFQKDDILMCICGTDLCNGPPLPIHPSPEDSIPLPGSRHQINLTSLQAVNASVDLGVKPQKVATTPEPRENVTSRNFDAKPHVINVSSEQGIKLTSESEVDVSSQLNVTFARDSSVPSRNTPRTRLNMTSARVNMTSPQDSNNSSRKVGVVTSQQSGGRSQAVSPETFKQRHQQNGTVIEAASISGGDRVSDYRCVTWVVVLYLWRFSWHLAHAGLHS
ncbi:hypothetical protein ACOMHN_038980 [Nucella lapillus]